MSAIGFDSFEVTPDRDQALSGRLTLDELRHAVTEGRINTVIVAFTDMQGRLLGKRVTARYFLQNGVTSQLFCDYLLATDIEMNLVPGYVASSWERGYGDLVAIPDLATLRAIPWLPKTAMVIADVASPGGEPLEHSPRQMLRRQLSRLEALGFAADMAGELEFYLFNQSYEDARESKYDNLKFSSWYPEDCHVFQTTKDEPFIGAVRSLMERADIPVEASVAECSPGQQEINLEYAEALEACDRLVLYKNGCKEIAHQMGKSVTFMAKLDEKLSGSSCHVHLSLRDLKTGQPGFYDPSRPDSMSELFRHFLAGAMKYAPAVTYFYAPNINSYKRFTAGTFAPTSLTWSVDNRTSAFRVLGGGKGLRFECRLPGADVNPYLTFAALIASGLQGVEEKLTLSKPFQGNSYEAENISTIPHALYRSLDCLERSTEMRAAFGDAVTDHYLHCGRTELRAFEASITEWEKLRVFERG